MESRDSSRQLFDFFFFSFASGEGGRKMKRGDGKGGERVEFFSFWKIDRWRIFPFEPYLFYLNFIYFYYVGLVKVNKFSNRKLSSSFLSLSLYLFLFINLNSTIGKRNCFVLVDCFRPFFPKFGVKKIPIRK